MRRTTKSALILPAILLAFPSISRAQSVYTYATAYAGTYMPYGTSKTDADSGYVNGSSSHAASVTDQADQYDDFNNVHWLRSSSASATVMASSGQLHLTALAQSSVSPSTYYNSDYGFTVNSPMTGVAISNANGTILDTVTITSATLPYGTPVNIKVTTTLDCSVSSPSYGNAEAEADVIFSKPGQNLTDDAGNSYFGFVDHKSVGGLVANDTDQTSDILHTFVGDSFTVELDAQVSAVGDANYQYPTGTAFADAGNTAYFNLDSMTPGADYATGSGLTYASPVPEPTSLAIIALVAMPLLQRRRRSR